MDLAETAQLASLADETPEGRSIVVLVKEKYNLRGRSVASADAGTDTRFIPFTSQTRMSGVDQGELRVRKGAADAVFPISVNVARPQRVRRSHTGSGHDLPCRGHAPRRDAERTGTRA